MFTVKQFQLWAAEKRSNIKYYGKQFRLRDGWLFNDINFQILINHSMVSSPRIPEPLRLLWTASRQDFIFHALWPLTWEYRFLRARGLTFLLMFFPLNLNYLLYFNFVLIFVFLIIDLWVARFQSCFWYHN